MVTEGNACGAIPEIERNLPLVVSAKSRGLPRRFAPRNDVFFFRLLSGAALAHRTRRNAGDGVPYEIKHVGTPVPGCPPPLGAWVRTPREGCPYGKTYRAVGLRSHLRVLMESPCRDTRPRVSPTFGRVNPDTPGGVSLQRSP